MGVVHPKIGSLLVHHVAEFQGVASDMLRQSVGSIIVAHQHHLVDQVAQQIAITQPDSGVLGDIHVVRNPDGVCRIAVFERQQTGHHLGEGGYELWLIGIPLTDDHTCRVVDEHPGLSRDGIQHFRPLNRVLFKQRTKGNRVYPADSLQPLLLRTKGSILRASHIACCHPAEQSQKQYPFGIATLVHLIAVYLLSAKIQNNHEYSKEIQMKILQNRRR